VIPIVDTLSRFVDQRVRVAGVTAESTLTRDTVPVNVDAIVFWLVWNAEKSILEVEDFVQAITMSAQTGLRESIGRHELAQMITERESLGRERNLKKCRHRDADLGFAAGTARLVNVHRHVDNLKLEAFRRE
jgi:regulator of protease activity HflC (stomatin/prohibitin superfamily)